MRPLRLELEGFTAFRQRTEIDFDGAELFVLCGPTGSGKSSVIDAMSFALFGSVARYQDPRLVHPAISQGLLEARVRFDFTVNGRAYTAVRVVRRKGPGATTREARLESGDQVLAGNVRELDDRIKTLFGLTFEQFNTCVVLPQGEFARFLHETPAHRQDLLKELLGLRVYERVGQLARERDKSIRAEMSALEQRLGDLAHATPDARKAARARLRDLKKLEKAVDEARPELEGWEKAERDHVAAAAEHAAQAGRLAGLKAPRDLDKLGQEEAAARAAMQHAEKVRADADTKHASAETACARLPDPQPLRDLRQGHLDREAEARKLAAAATQESSLREAKEKTDASFRQAQEEEVTARARVDDAKHKHAAASLASGLSAGDECPVCLRPLEAKPRHARPPAMERAEGDLKAAERARASADKSAREALEHHARAAATLGDLKARVAKLDERLRTAPPREEIDKQLAVIAEAAERLAAARAALQKAQQAERAAREACERQAERIGKAWSDFDRQRDALAAAAGAPVVDRTSLTGSWQALLTWAQAAAATEELKARAAKKAAETAAASRQEKLAALGAACAEAGVEVGKGGPRDAVIRATTQAEHDLKGIEADLARRDELDAALAEARQRQAVAHALAGHLSANAFERWLLREAFDSLVSGASERLRELSGGDYSFRMSEQLNFEIIDHRNADEPRMARTLSGGETFLASLALALTLADQVAELASEGAARLESIFLDEGFGALDPDALETVTATIEDLAARGRTVGVVTHVRELAERIPVQYRVRKGSTSSLIEKVVT